MRKHFVRSVGAGSCHKFFWCQTTLHILVSRRGTFKVPPEIFYHIKQLKLCFKIVFISCSNSTYQLGFHGVEIGSNLPIFKMTETMFLLTAEIFSFQQLIQSKLLYYEEQERVYFVATFY